MAGQGEIAVQVCQNIPAEPGKAAIEDRGQAKARVQAQQAGQTGASRT